ncbi:cytochrome P450 [Intrasporangium calvum]|uniref:Cytochrome P450 n=1 Tax=Intrasporangium calvum (strain ATCC 23552 / DSM 43043 / JCM 3097 / NBRC 12989 / NCIMB 10167 / NRRL B-3866 / 7 KIP) TaxID=710696 RepID=E6S6V7_INTC7|nr:cytochrome P450 [Intrasporangium calvum]ADU46843.1 cytochrome P450 [Intrasporangium calvum DSM 43043]
MSETAEATRLLHDPSTYVDGVPFGVLADLRREHGVVRVEEPAQVGWPEGPGYWLVLRHPDVVRVLREPRTFSSWLGGTQIRDPATPADLAFVRRMMLNMDPPEHSRLRRMLAKSFTPRAVAALEGQIGAHARTIVDRMLDGPRECDFAKDVAADLPLLALADILGVPPSDRWLMFDWSNRVIGWQDPDYASSAAFTGEGGSDLAAAALAVRPSPGPDGRMPDPRSRAGMPDLYTYAAGLGERKRADPGHDVMSILMAQRDDSAGGDGHVSVEEFENLFWLFAVAGNETLRNGLPGAMIGLLDNPDAQEALRRDPARIAPAVDELLRWWTPVMTFRRTATVDTEIAEQPIAAGDKVVVSFASANRDEAVFADPDGLDLDRNAKAHLAFGHGPHFCLGAHLARVQMSALFTEVLTRTSWIQAAGEPAHLRSNFQRGVKRLPVRWTA